MAFNAITIRDALDQISGNRLVLPAIQREVVWWASQIVRLFDSLMRGYPIGSFLFWRVPEERKTDYRFYDFITKYHERDSHNQLLNKLPPGDVTAVLDGQQRLTALNIGLAHHGSYAWRLKGKHRSKDASYPERHLYLNLKAEPNEDDDDLRYAFSFEREKDAAKHDSETYWYPVRRILKMEHIDDITDFVEREDLSATNEPLKLLLRLHKMVHESRVVSFYLDESKELHDVLSIFVRTNSGGTVLSRSDMMLATATAEWKKHNAREEIHNFVDEINAIGNRFTFTKDFVLKSCLMLADLNTAFRHFGKSPMSQIEDGWDGIRRSLRTAVRFVSDIGYDAHTLTSQNALMPIAYYVHRNGWEEEWLEQKFEEDRRRVQQWLIKALLKRGVWGSGLDGLLGGLRSALQEQTRQFPIDDLEREMRRRGKSLVFETEELENLVDVRFGDPRAYGVLSLLYPFDVEETRFHVDHIVPRAKLAKSALAKEGVPREEIDEFLTKMNGLANLQLLDRAENLRKSAKMPAQWLEEKHAEPERRRRYQEDRHLEGLPEHVSDFPAFYDRRRSAMLRRLRSLLASPTSQATG